MAIAVHIDGHEKIKVLIPIVEGLDLLKGGARGSSWITAISPPTSAANVRSTALMVDDIRATPSEDCSRLILSSWPRPPDLVESEASMVIDFAVSLKRGYPGHRLRQNPR